MTTSVAVVGLGYVGLPVALAAANAGLSVIGIDSNPEVTNKLKLGKSHISEIKDEEIRSVIDSKKFYISEDFEEIKNVQVIVIAVPTPLTETGKPDLTILTDCVKSVAKYTQDEQLIILESTVAPKTTREVIVPIFEVNAQREKSTNYFAFSPERIDPGNKIWKLNNTPKIISGINKKSIDLAYQFYSCFIEELIICSSIEVAETAKLLENSFRLINISFINELFIFCEKLGIDVNEVIDVASSKPYGFMPFRPSFGAGGHCIPVDPMYLSEIARQLGTPIKTIELAASINSSMSEYFINKAKLIYGDLAGLKIIVVGVAYKANISDARETPARNLIRDLRNLGAKVFWHDNLVKVWNNEMSSPLDSRYDLAFLVTHHDYVDLTSLGSVPLIRISGSI